jgi:hypothetical protein
MEPKPRMVRVADGMANRLDKRHRATGNGQVPIVAAAAWKILSENTEIADASRSAHRAFDVDRLAELTPRRGA